MTKLFKMCGKRKVMVALFMGVFGFGMQRGITPLDDSSVNLAQRADDAEKLYQRGYLSADEVTALKTLRRELDEQILVLKIRMHEQGDLKELQQESEHLEVVREALCAIEEKNRSAVAMIHRNPLATGMVTVGSIAGIAYIVYLLQRYFERVTSASSEKAGKETIEALKKEIEALKQGSVANKVIQGGSVALSRAKEGVSAGWEGTRRFCDAAKKGAGITASYVSQKALDGLGAARTYAQPKVARGLAATQHAYAATKNGAGPAASYVLQGAANGLGATRAYAQPKVARGLAATQHAYAATKQGVGSAASYASQTAAGGRDAFYAGCTAVKGGAGAATQATRDGLGFVSQKAGDGWAATQHGVGTAASYVSQTAAGGRDALYGGYDAVKGGASAVTHALLATVGPWLQKAINVVTLRGVLRREEADVPEGKQEE